jgi:hypothetical protein
MHASDLASKRLTKSTTTKLRLPSRKTGQGLASPIGRDMRQAEREILAELYVSLLGHGHIETAGKNEEQLYLELVKEAVEWAKHRPMRMSMDFRPNLLNKARSLKRRNELNEATLYYATWFEHWINFFFMRKTHVLDENEFRQMIRDVNVRGKYTWLLALAVGQRIPEKHLRAILRICELRNEFVHYKFKLVDADKFEDEVKQRRQTYQAAENAVRYLEGFETKHLFKGPARRLLKNLRHTKRERNRAARSHAHKKRS